MSDDLGVWLYAVTRTGAGIAELDDLTGVAGEPPRPVRSGELAAVVGSVPLAVFGDLPLRRNLEDLDWLETTARAHDAVISALLRRGPVIPLRLATVFLDDDRVVRMLDERRADFDSALTLVSGRTEWGVKAYCDRTALAAAVAGADTASTAGGKGTAYLARRRAQLSAQETVERDAAARAEEIHGQLVRRAAAGRCQPLTDPVLHGRRDWLILNGTYLVDDAAAREFAAAVAELDRAVPGIRLELTGPWPPYSFAGVDRATS
ncbi:GvpL/GvpF family gas vesicle protein [Nocardia carnea]|uniref:GvpL/GvpF family gas vesicle protein n=1 Tax=Nocardia carnea TaxID=37328 RepID=UPI0024540983|nr:GvpL/GvpF family gas vesicle protein [Nocardia carnea]